MFPSLNGQKLFRVSANILFFSVVLLPIVFVPMQKVPLFFTKTAFLSLGVGFSFLFLFIHLFKNKENLIIPKSPVFVLPLLILLATLASSIASPHFGLSFSGYGFEVGTFVSLYLLWSVFFLAFFLFKDKRLALKSVLSVLVVFTVLAIYHILRLIPGLDFMSFGTFAKKIDSPLGNWNELGFLAGLSVLYSLILLESIFKEKDSLGRKFLYLSLVLGLVVSFLVNIFLVWALLFVSVATFLVVQLVHRRKSDNATNSAFSVDGVKSSDVSAGRKRFSPAVSLSLLLIVLLFLIGVFFGQTVQSGIGINYLDVKPSWQSTGQVLLSTYRTDFKNFLFGSGPNSFLFEWRQWHPQEINMTVFWNSEFYSGAGLIPTFAITTGALGLLSWVLFLFFFVWIGVRETFKKPENGLATTLFFGSCYLWLASILYPTSHIIFVLAMFFSGIFLAIIFKTETSRAFSLDLSGQNKKTKAVSLVILSVFTAFSLFVAILSVQKTAAAVSFQKGIIDFSLGQNIEAGKNLKQAVDLSGNDIFYRHLSEYFIIEASEMARSIDEPTEQDIQMFRTAVESARHHAELAVLFNRKNFENWIQLGSFYEFLATFDTGNASEHYENARLSYQSARVFDRQNPFLDLMLARLKISLGSLGEAEEYIESALAKKSNYSEAIFLLSRVKALQGDLEEAIESTNEAIGLMPQEPSGYFQLGVLHYQDNDFENAERAFSVALSLEPQYANARYFLGLSSIKTGKIDDAINHFRVLRGIFPGNEEVALILSNLETGREPFEVESEEIEIIPPEERDGLPLGE